MKKITAILLFAMLLLLSACFERQTEPEDTNSEAVDTEECTVWQSNSATLDGVSIDFSESPMTMLLALFEDGVFQMTVSIGGETLPNFPQEGKYTLEDSVLTLDSGWLGIIKDGTMTLSQTSDEASLAFYCEKVTAE